MKSFRVVIVTILLMALLMTSDAGKRKNCKKQLKEIKEQLGRVKAELQEVKERNSELENENAELKEELEGVGEDCYTKPVGISDQGQIPDNQMTASSQYGTGYQPAYGRLNGERGDGWCAKEASRNDDWLQVDLGETIKVCALATQGDRNGNEWVTAFKLSYSTDGNNWTPYKDANGAEVEFHRQGDSNTVDQHKLPVPVTARYLRFNPTQRHAWNCLRVEVHGTEE